MKSSVLVFIDLETTGHDPLKFVDGKLGLWHEIIDIGAVFVDSVTRDSIGHEYSVLVRPKHPERCIPDLINYYPERAKHGEWDKAVSLRRGIWGFLIACMQFGKDSIPIPGGQNFSFDWSFLVSAFASLGIPEEEWRKYLSYKRFETGSMGMQELWDPRTPLDLSDYSLRSGKFQKSFDLPPEPLPHRAINGAWQSYRAWKALQERKLSRLLAL